MCLSLLVFRQLFFEFAQSQSAKPARKQNLTRNSHSWAIKVMHFGISENPTMDCISPYNSNGLISTMHSVSKVSKNSQRKRWKLPFSTTHALLFDAPFPGNLREYSHKSFTARNYITAGDSIGLSSFIFCGGLQKTHIFCSRVRIGRSRSSKVVDFGTNRKGVCNFLLVINGNFGPIFW